MIYNIKLTLLSFAPFFNISKYFLFAWSVINFMKCLYVTMSITSKRLPPLATVAIFTGIIVIYLIETRDFTWLLILQLLDLLLIVYTVLTKRDSIFLLALLSLTIYFLKPFAFIVDMFVVLFMAIDFAITIFENTPYWSVMYMNCLFVSGVMAQINSQGPDSFKFVLNSVYVCFFWGVCWCASNRLRPMPMLVANVIYVVAQFNREEPISFESSKFSQLSSRIRELNLL